MFVRLFCLIAATLLASPAWAQDYKVGSLEISQPWTRATPPTAKAGGGSACPKCEQLHAAHARKKKHHAGQKAEKRVEKLMNRVPGQNAQ